MLAGNELKSLGKKITNKTMKELNCRVNISSVPKEMTNKKGKKKELSWQKKKNCLHQAVL